MSLILICWSVKHVIMISSGLNMHAKKLQMFVFLIFYIVNYFKIYGEFKQQVQIYSILFKKHSLGVENSSFFLGLLL
ncbi:hypothetical protein, partial [Prevotella sp.]|uniref:hypothetical protein n=1 Tax=Prevotella sp. TaxID=59823 RepID=UPI00257DC31A